MIDVTFNVLYSFIYFFITLFVIVLLINIYVQHLLSFITLLNRAIAAVAAGLNFPFLDLVYDTFFPFFSSFTLLKYFIYLTCLTFSYNSANNQYFFGLICILYSTTIMSAFLNNFHTFIN